MVESIKELRKICQGESYVYGKKPKIKEGKFTKKDLAEQNFYDQFLRFFSIYLVKIFLYTKITANQISIISMIVGAGAGLFFAVPNIWYWLIGFLVLHLFFVLDAVDGEVARYRKACSPMGRYFDVLAHGVVIAFVIMGMTYGIYQTINHSFVFLVGLWTIICILVYGQSTSLRNYFLYQYALSQNDPKIAQKKKTKKTKPAKLKFILRRFLSFYGVAYVIPISAALDIFLDISSPLPIKLNFKFILLLALAILSPLLIIKDMLIASKIDQRIKCMRKN